MQIDRSSVKWNPELHSGRLLSNRLALRTKATQGKRGPAASPASLPEYNSGFRQEPRAMEPRVALGPVAQQLICLRTKATQGKRGPAASPASLPEYNSGFRHGPWAMEPDWVRLHLPELRQKAAAHRQRFVATVEVDRGGLVVVPDQLLDRP